MFGMTLAFAAAGIGQVYLERILGLGYLESQLKIQVHFLMLIATGFLFALGVALFIWDFFRTAPALDPDRTDPADRTCGGVIDGRRAGKADVAGDHPSTGHVFQAAGGAVLSRPGRRGRRCSGNVMRATWR